MKISKQYLKKIILEELEKQISIDAEKSRIANDIAARAMENYSKLVPQFAELKARLSQLPEPNAQNKNQELKNAMYNINQTAADSSLISLFRDAVANNAWNAMRYAYNPKINISDEAKETIEDMRINIYGKHGEELKTAIIDGFNNPTNDKSIDAARILILKANGFTQPERIKFKYWSNPPTKYAIRFKSHNKYR